VIFHFSNGVVQISLPDEVDILADSPKEAEQEYLALLLEVGEVTAFTAEGEMGTGPRPSCVHPTFTDHSDSQS